MRKYNYREPGLSLIAPLADIAEGHQRFLFKSLLSILSINQTVVQFLSQGLQNVPNKHNSSNVDIYFTALQ